MDIQTMDKPSVLLQLKRITEQNLPIKGTYVKTLKQEDIFDAPVNKTTELHSVKVGNQQILIPIVKEEELTQGAISDDLVMKLLSKIKDKKSREVLSAYIEQEEDINLKKPIIIAKDKIQEKEGEETDETVLLKERKDEILKAARQFKTVKELMDYLETEKIDDFKKELKDNKLTVTLSALTRSLNAIKKRLETTGYIEMKKAEEEEAKRKAKEEEEGSKRKVKEEQQLLRLEKQKDKLAEQQRKKEEQERKQKEKEEEQKRKKTEKKTKAVPEPKEMKKKVAELNLEETIKEIEREKEMLEKPSKKEKKEKKKKQKKDVSQMTKQEVAQEIRLEKTKVMTKEEVKEELEAATKKPEEKTESKPTMTDKQVKDLKDAFIKDIKSIVKEKKISSKKLLKALLKEKGYEELKEELTGAGFKSSATGLVKSINAIINGMPN